MRDILRFAVGTDLYVRDRASPTAPERNVTQRFTEGTGDVSGVEISSDGRKVLFAMRGPVDEGLALDDPDQPKWNIWEYEIATDTLRRLIVSDLTAQQGHDLSPHYLPDGRIIFVSTRQQTAKAILINDGKPQYDARDEDREEPAFVLHVMRDDGRDEFKQVSFNQSSDYEPTVLDNGKVLFSRWDHAGNVNGIHLYQMNPDGTELELLYGAESHLTGTNNGTVQFVSAREMLDGRIMAILRPFDHPELGGAITIIDTKTYVENTQPVASFGRHAGSGADGRDAESSAHRPRAVAGRPLQLGVPAVGRHGPRADDLVDLPARGARPRQPDRPDRGDLSCRARRSASPRRIPRPSSRRRSTACGCTTRRRRRSSRS